MFSHIELMWIKVVSQFMHPPQFVNSGGCPTRDHLVPCLHNDQPPQAMSKRSWSDVQNGPETTSAPGKEEQDGVLPCAQDTPPDNSKVCAPLQQKIARPEHFSIVLSSSMSSCCQVDQPLECDADHHANQKPGTTEPHADRAHGCAQGRVSIFFPV